jgi:hypothetical protein
MEAADTLPPPPKQPVPASVIPTPLAGDSSFAGEWTGRISLTRGSVPVHLIVAADGTARGAVSADSLEVVQGAGVTDGLLEGQIAGALPVAETAGQTQSLGVKLRRVGAVLEGYVGAQVRLDNRPFLVLPFPMCLWKTNAGKPVDRTAPATCGPSE